MSHHICYQLELITDAEPGSGLGTELVNDLISRDHTGNPVLRGTHLKGLLREQIKVLLENENFTQDVEDLLFGVPGDDLDNEGQEGFLRIPDLSLKLKDPAKTIDTREISRTALHAHGAVKTGSLRTTEAIPAETIFKGKLHFRRPLSSPYLNLLKAAMMSVPAVGGGRTRGSGACCISFKDEKRAPGELFHAFLDACKEGNLPEIPNPEKQEQQLEDQPNMVWVRLIFEANEPVCCPETSGTRNLNVISSGIDIPASAVLGGVISRIAERSDILATETLRHPETRFWPLLPVPDTDTTPVRVALSHRMSKLAEESEVGENMHLFKDAAIEPYKWDELPKGTTMKGSDGVLLVKDGEINLWKSGEIPRVYTSHAVHHDPGGERDRNLFTMESLAPAMFVGMAYLPASAVEVLKSELDRPITFGKSRSVRGGGELRLETITPDFSKWNQKVWVLQSPVALPDDLDGEESAEEWMCQLVRDAGWGEVDMQPRAESEIRVQNLANCGVRFGWNRHGIGTTVSGSARLKARKVFLPGSVFVLKEAPSNPLDLMVKGLGGTLEDGTCEGRLQGYGALMPHPGKAGSRYAPPMKHVERKSTDVGKKAMEWFMKTGNSHPSPSQISAVAERIKENDGTEAVNYLNQQMDRASRVWERWRKVAKDIQDTIRDDPETAKKALRTWRDLCIANRDSSNSH